MKHGSKHKQDGEQLQPSSSKTTKKGKIHFLKDHVNFTLVDSKFMENERFDYSRSGKLYENLK